MAMKDFQEDEVKKMIFNPAAIHVSQTWEGFDFWYEDQHSISLLCFFAVDDRNNESASFPIRFVGSIIDDNDYYSILRSEIELSPPIHHHCCIRGRLFGFWGDNLAFVTDTTDPNCVVYHGNRGIGL
jgi:hypothetical protein